MGIPLYVICCFFLLFLRFFVYLSFLSVWLLCVLVCFSLGFSCLGLCTSSTWVTLSFPMLGKFSTIFSSNIYSGPFSLSSPSGTPMLWIFLYLIFSQDSLRLSSFHFILFSLFCPMTVIYTILLAHLSVLLLHLFCYWFLLVYSSFHLLYLCLFFNFSRSLVFFNFSVLLKSLFILN